MPHYHAHHDHDERTHDEVNIANHPHCDKNVDYKSLKENNTKILSIIMIVTILFTIVEFGGAIWSGSLALLSDSFHMLTDSAAILLALFMAKLSQKPANNNYSYGHGRSETIGALINGLFMVGVVFYLVFEGVNRIMNPEPVKAVGIMIIATAGLLVNLFAIYMLKDAHSLNTKAALIHVIGDLLGSIAAILAGVIIYFTGYTIFDPILSILVSMIMVMPAYSLIKRSLHVLMEGVPVGIEYEKVGETINNIEGVVSTHDLHIWTMASDHVSLSAHVTIEKPEDWNTILTKIQVELAEKYNILHVTLQPELHNH